MSSYPVRLVAPSGKEQGVLLGIRRDGLWLFTEHGKEIQQLPYQHIVKWLPSKLRSKDPGSDDCLDIQVETVNGRKDLRMRCQSVAAVNTIITDIRTTVQAVMSELDSHQSQQSSPLRAGLAISATAAAAAADPQSPPKRSSGAAGAAVLPPAPAPPPPPPLPASAAKQTGAAAETTQDAAARDRLPSTTRLLPAQVASSISQEQQQAGDLGQQWQQAVTHQQAEQQPYLVFQQHQPHQHEQPLPSSSQLEDLQQQPGLKQLQLQEQTHLLHAVQRHGEPSAQQQPIQQHPAPPEQLRDHSMMGHALHCSTQPAPVLAPAGAGGASNWMQASSALHKQAVATASGAVLAAASLGTASGVLPPGSPGSSPGRFVYSKPTSALPFPPVGLKVSMSQSKFGSKEMELDPLQDPPAGPAGFGVQQLAVDMHKLGLTVAAPTLRRNSTGALSDLESAAQIAFLEELVRRLSEELASHKASEPLAAVTAAAAGSSSSTGTSAGVLGGAARGLPLPPWLKDSRYLNPLLSAYDQRLLEAQRQLAAKSMAVQEIEQQVQELVSENDSLHERLATQVAQLEARTTDPGAAAAAAGRAGPDPARWQERLDLLEQENDLLLEQQSELDHELAKLAAQLQEQEQQAMAARGAAKALADRCAELERALEESAMAVGSSRRMRDEVEHLGEKLQEESGKTAAARTAVEAAHQRIAALQAELASASAASNMVPRLQSEVSKARAAAEASASDATTARSEAEGLRAALRAVESRLLEYQQKDTEVYLRIKQAMELAEEARLERDAARATTDSLAAQLSSTQARLQEATRQLSGGSVGGGPSWDELRRKLTAAETALAAAQTQLQKQEVQLTEQRLTAQRLSRDKASLAGELSTLRHELCLCSGGVHSPVSAAAVAVGGALTGEARGVTGFAATERLVEAERARDIALQKLDSHKRAATRAEQQWQLERQQLQSDVQHWTKRAVAAEAAAAAAGSSTAEAQQAAAAAAAELAGLKAAHSRVESQLRQKVAELQEQRDAEVAAIAQKLDRALAACNMSVVDAERMLSAKDQLLAQWKQEAQLIASKLESTVQQHQAELAERQDQADQLSGQLAAAQQQQEDLQQELEATRVACQESDLLLVEADARALAAVTSATAQQEELLQELHNLQSEVERCHLEKLRAERMRDSMTVKLDRLIGTAPIGSLHSSYDASRSAAAGSLSSTRLVSAAGRLQDGGGAWDWPKVLANEEGPVAEQERLGELSQQRDQQLQDLPGQQVQQQQQGLPVKHAGRGVSC